MCSINASSFGCSNSKPTLSPHTLLSRSSVVQLGIGTMELYVKPDEVALALTILVALLTISSIQTLVKTARFVKRPAHEETLYEDIDGAATKESTAEFSNTIQFIIIFVAAILGLGISITDAIFAAVKEDLDFSRSGVPLSAIWLLSLQWVSHQPTI